MQKNFRFSKKQEGTVLKHPPYGGGGLTPPSTNYINGYGWQWKSLSL